MSPWPTVFVFTIFVWSSAIEVQVISLCVSSHNFFLLQQPFLPQSLCQSREHNNVVKTTASFGIRQTNNCPLPTNVASLETPTDRSSVGQSFWSNGKCPLIKTTKKKERNPIFLIKSFKRVQFEKSLPHHPPTQNIPIQFKHSRQLNILQLKFLSVGLSSVVGVYSLSTH